LTETEIIAGCKKDKRQYQKALVDTYAPRLFTVARRYTRDDHSAKDILQDALHLIFKNIKKYKPTGSFQAWMKRVVVTTALKHLRDKDFLKNVVEFQPAHSNSLHPEAYSKLDYEAIIYLIKELPKGAREVFNLYVIDGYNHNEIGELLSISAATSRSQLTRARKWLRFQLIEEKKTEICG
jgi:RNA polymerase sigma-70 factor (ECF subfamily)